MSYVTSSQVISAVAAELNNTSSLGDGQRIGAVISLANQDIDFGKVTLSKLQTAYDRATALTQFTGYEPISDLRLLSIVVTSSVGVSSTSSYLGKLSNQQNSDTGVTKTQTFDSSGGVVGSPVIDRSADTNFSSTELVIGNPSSVFVDTQTLQDLQFTSSQNPSAGAVFRNSDSYNPYSGGRKSENSDNFDRYVNFP